MIIFGLERFGNPVDWEWPPAWVGTAKGEAVDRNSVGPSLGNPLEREMAILSLRLPFAAVAMLEALGVPRGFIGKLTGAGEIGRVRASVSADGLWHQDEAGRPMLALAVRDAWGVLDDFVCFSSDTPDQWAQLRDSAAVLGADYLEREAVTEGRVRLFGTPLDWLRGEGRGICVLDWRPEAVGALRALGRAVTIECDSPAAAEALANVLRWDGLPRVAGATAEMGRAA